MDSYSKAAWWMDLLSFTFKGRPKSITATGQECLLWGLYFAITDFANEETETEKL
jgi:hypothetical protein